MRGFLEGQQKGNLFMMKGKGPLGDYILGRWTFSGSGLSLIQLFWGQTIWPHLHLPITIIVEYPLGKWPLCMFTSD